MTEKNKPAIKESLNIRLVLDRSGSMRSCKTETIDSINQYIQELKKETIDGIFTLSTFDSQAIDIPIRRVPVTEMSLLNQDILIPRGGTPLYDAIGAAVFDLEQFKYADSEKKVLVIVTDGLENASQEYTSDAIKKTIEEKTKEGWLIIYLGADHDAFTQSRDMGFDSRKTLHYSKRDSRDAFRAVADKTTSYYKGHRPENIEFFDQERKVSNKEMYKLEEE